MADEQTTLISGRAGSTSSLTVFCSKIYQSSWVHSKGEIIVLIWFCLIVISNNGVASSAFLLDDVSIWSIVPARVLVYLLFPVFGYLGEKWTRYKVIMVGVITIAIGYVINLTLLTVIVTLDVHHGIRITIEYLCIVTILITVLGYLLVI